MIINRLKDIAERAGVTVSSVSKALKNSPEISRETALRVQQVAQELGYIAKKSSRKSSQTIGVILPEVRSQYFAELMQELSNEIDNRGFSMITMLTKGYAADLMPAVEKILCHRLGGLLISSDYVIPDEVRQRLLDSDVPTILLTENDMPYLFDSIYIKTETGVWLALDHLLQLGHKEFGYLGEYNSDDRFQAMREYLKQNDIEINPRFVKRGSERLEEGGYLRALELLKEKELPTAIVTSYDQIAYGAMRAFREHGFRVPDDISIVGFDNIVMDEYLPTPLTSVTNPVRQMGITAVNILLDAIRNPDTHVVQNVALQSRLVVRSSTGKPREG